MNGAGEYPNHNREAIPPGFQWQPLPQTLTFWTPKWRWISPISFRNSFRGDFQVNHPSFSREYIYIYICPWCSMYGLFIYIHGAFGPLSWVQLKLSGSMPINCNQENGQKLESEEVFGPHKSNQNTSWAGIWKTRVSSTPKKHRTGSNKKLSPSCKFCWDLFWCWCCF